MLNMCCKDSANSTYIGITFYDYLYFGNLDCGDTASNTEFGKY